MPLAEKVLAKPLSGHEIVEAILHTVKIAFSHQAKRVPREVVAEFTNRLRANMKRDCFLNNIISYAVYSSETTVNINFQYQEPGFFEIRSMTKIEFPSTGTAIRNTMVGCTTRMGEPNAEKELETAEIVAKDSPRAPNEVRVNTEQPVHVRVQGPQGRISEKTLKYQQKPQKAATA